MTVEQCSRNHKLLIPVSVVEKGTHEAWYNGLSHEIEYHCVAVTKHSSVSGRAGFESRSRDWLSWLRLCVNYLSSPPPQANGGAVP